LFVGVELADKHC